MSDLDLAEVRALLARAAPHDAIDRDAQAWSAQRQLLAYVLPLLVEELERRRAGCLVDAPEPGPAPLVVLPETVPALLFAAVLTAAADWCERVYGQRVDMTHLLRQRTQWGLALVLPAPVPDADRTGDGPTHHSETERDTPPWNTPDDSKEDGHG